MIDLDYATIDFETYYDKDYSLSKMMTDAYVLDPRFQIIGVSLRASRNAEAQWFTSPRLEDYTEWLSVNLNWETTAVCAHHAHFDAFIATQRLGLKPLLWVDTLSMSRMLYPRRKSYSLAALAADLLGDAKGNEVVAAMGKRLEDFTQWELARYGEYCKHDTDLCCQLAAMFLAGETTGLEMRLIDMAVRMFSEPVLIGDQQVLKDYHKEEMARKAALLLATSADKDTIMSNPKLAEALLARGVIPPMKISATTGKETFAFAKTDKAFKALLEHDDPDVQTLVAARLGVKSTIAETRAVKFLEMAERGPLPMYLHHWGAKTSGRQSGGNQVNVQNIPARGPASTLRKAMCAPPGHTVVVGDSSNIELRFAMAAAGEHDAVDKLRSGVDMYCDFATDMYRREITKQDKNERMMGKVAMLSCIAEGEQVLTPRGLVPVEEISVDDLVWDGVDWVSHAGVVCNGHREVIYYDGLWATPDHKVYLERGAWCEFGEAASSGERVARTGDGGRAVRLVGDSRYEPAGRSALDGAVPVHLRHAEAGERVKPPGGPHCRVPELRVESASHQRGQVGGARRPGDRAAAKGSQQYAGQVHQRALRSVEILRGAWRAVLVQLRARVRGILVSDAGWGARDGSGPRRQQWALRPWQFAVDYAAGPVGEPAQHRHGSSTRHRDAAFAVGESIRGEHDVPVRGHRGAIGGGNSGNRPSCGAGEAQDVALTRRAPRVARVYDIVNAGPRNRFTVSGQLVHNCQYGTGPDTFREMARGFGLNLSPAEAEDVVALYRKKYRKMKEWWYYCGDTVLKAVERGRPLVAVDRAGWMATTHQGFSVPGNPGVVYKDLRMGQDGNYEYWSGRNWTKIYSGKVVENACQYGARMVVMWQAARLHRHFTVNLMVHDEMMCVVPEAEAEECQAFMLECLRLAPPWCRGDLPLDGEVHIGNNYGECK